MIGPVPGSMAKNSSGGRASGSGGAIGIEKGRSNSRSLVPGSSTEQVIVATATAAIVRTFVDHVDPGDHRLAPATQHSRVQAERTAMGEVGEGHHHRGGDHPLGEDRDAGSESAEVVE